MADWLVICLIGTVVFCTFTVEGIAGFGSTVMALPFVIMLIGLDKAVPLLSTLNLLLSIFLIWRSWRNLVFREYLFIVINAAPGVVAGLLLADILPQKLLIMILSAFTWFVGIRGLIRVCSPALQSTGSLTKKNPLHCLLLFAGGIFQGAFSSGGPLVVMYAAQALPEKKQFRGTLPLLWLTTNTIMQVKWVLSGNVWDAIFLRQFCWALPFIVGGMLLGDHLHNKVNQKKFTILVYSLLIVVGSILCIANL